MSCKYIGFVRTSALSVGELMADLVYGVQGGYRGETLGNIDRKAIEYGMAMMVLDHIVSRETGFKNFKDLLNADGGYRPTIRCNDKRFYKGDEGVDLTFLADAYDFVQTLRGDSRRVFGRG